MMDIETLILPGDSDAPNHPRWPLIVYRRALDPEERDLATGFEEAFARSGWVDSWRNGIFSYTHFHSNAHEVLGIARGRAEVRFGGARGPALEVEAGDAALLPAGTGHCLLSSSRDLLVIGAYPPGESRDLLRPGDLDMTEIRRRVAAVARPASDPITGAAQPLFAHWPT